MADLSQIITFNNPVLKGFFFYGAVLGLKCMAMSILTARQRFKNKEMAGITEILSIDNPVLRGYCFYGSLLALKMMAMSILTSRQRLKNKAFANPEDAANLKAKPRVDENVERVRRAHLNDLENIPIFYFVSFGYLFTNPAAGTALLLFRVFTIARFIHTLVYAVVVVPQPARALAWFTGYAITGYMAVQTILHFW